MIRPFKNYEEFSISAINHGGIRYKTPWTNTYLYPSCHHEYAEDNGIGLCFNIYNGIKYILWEDLLKSYEFNDGTKCGIWDDELGKFK